MHGGLWTNSPFEDDQTGINGKGKICSLHKMINDHFPQKADNFEELHQTISGLIITTEPCLSIQFHEQFSVMQSV